MFSRQAVRSSRMLRTARLSQRRFASDTAEVAKPAGSALVGGLTGGAIVLAAGYGYYHFSGAKTLVNTAHSTKAQFDQLTESLKKSTPEPNEALKWLKQTATSYASFIPGGKHYVDTAFKDLETIQEKHSGEVDEIVSKTYDQLKATSAKGMNIQTANEAWGILQDALKKIGELAGDSANEILNNHPELKDKIGGNLDKLKSMGDSLGPEAKKQVDETWSQIRDIVKGGVGVEAIAKIKKLVQDKTSQIQKLGDEAWSKGLEQAKPYLDKSPQVKELIEKNADSLKSGNFKDLYEKIKTAVEKGDTGDLESFVKDIASKAKDSEYGDEIQKYVKMIPGGEQVIPKLKQLKEVAEKHGDDAEKIMKKTYQEVIDVLSKGINDAEKLADKAKKDAKK